jgi:phosphatidate cytidylyltransferase
VSNLAVRVLIALVGIPVILLLTIAGGFYFFGFVAVVSAAALLEFYDIAKRKGAFPLSAAGIVFGFLINGVFLYDKLRYVLLTALESSGISIPFPSMMQWFMILFLLFVPFLVGAELFRNKGSALFNLSTTILGVCYTSLFLGSLIGLREIFIPGDFPVYRFFSVSGVDIPVQVAVTVYRWGGLTVIAVFASVWVCDSAAYFAGRAFGKHKLFERISPNKTWEGAIAGLVGALAAFLVVRQTALPYMTVTHAVVCGAIVGVFGQVGDLVESLFKRDAGIKDSSRIIPGHGGVLDRFDSLLFVSPLIFFYIDFIVLS